MHLPVNPTLSSFYLLSLEMPGYNTTLEACLANFFAPQERQWQCDKCKQHRPQSVAKSPVGTYQIRCAGFPQIVILHLKRFKNNASGSSIGGSKTRVDFPKEKLAFGSVCNCTDSPKPKYDLMSVIQCITTHGQTGGHFVTNARHTVDQAWQLFDDSTVRAPNASDWCSTRLYVRFISAM